MHYVIVNRSTGEIENDCPHCLVGRIPDTQDLSLLDIDGEHIILEVTREEYESISRSIVYTYEENGEVKQSADRPLDVVAPTPSYSLRVEMENAAQRIDKRRHEETPVEAEGYGGKEIIAHEEKPVGVLVEIRKEV